MDFLCKNQKKKKQYSFDTASAFSKAQNIIQLPDITIFHVSFIQLLFTQQARFVAFFGIVINLRACLCVRIIKLNY